MSRNYPDKWLETLQRNQKIIARNGSTFDVGTSKVGRTANHYTATFDRTCIYHNDSEKWKLALKVS
jgi:hypothetical protein